VFGIVTRGRVQLEVRDGESGPVLGCNAGFWLRATGVRRKDVAAAALRQADDHQSQ
jgi:hypothetical protein